MKDEEVLVQIRVRGKNRKKLKVLAAENDTDVDGAVTLLLENGKSTGRGR